MITTSQRKLWELYKDIRLKKYPAGSAVMICDRHGADWENAKIVRKVALISPGHFWYQVDSGSGWEAIQTERDLMTVQEFMQSQNNFYLKNCVRITGLMFLVDYGTVPVFLSLGFRAMFHTASVMQWCVFVPASFIVQKRIVESLDLAKDYRIGIGPNEFEWKIGPFPVPHFMVLERYCWKRVWHMITLVPNYPHIHTGAVLAGTSYATWSQSMQERFFRTWSYIPWIGSVVGGCSLPLILTLFLVINCVCHGVGFMIFARKKDWPQMFDAAGLLFVGKVMEPLGSHGPVKYSRWAAAYFCKLPLLWAKEATVALLYPDMSAQAVVQAVIAILLAWYTIVPLLKVVPALFVEAFKSKSVVLFAAAFAITIPIVKLNLQFYGIFGCDSHDFSLYLLGCAPAS